MVLEVGILGTFLALDLVLFFLFFEVVLLPMYAVIAGWGGADRRRAARKFVLYTLFGSVLLLLGVFTVVATAGTGDLVALTGGAGLGRSTQYMAFALFAVAFAVKAPLWPLHTWLPDAHTQAPTVGSVILAGVLLKMGTYGLIRVGVGVAPLGAAWAAPVLGVLAAAAIMAGSLICLRQTELKRLIAYSSVGHMGFVLLGIATLTATGLQAALIGNVAHGLITGLLFFLAGAIKDRAHTGVLAELGGLRETAPRLAGLLGFAAIASLGLPGLAGFWGEAFAVVAAVRARRRPVDHARGAGRDRRRADRGVLPAAAAPGDARPGRPAGPARRSPAPNGSPGRRWCVLTLAVGLVPALVLAATDATRARLLHRGRCDDHRPRRPAAAVRRGRHRGPGAADGPAGRPARRHGRLAGASAAWPPRSARSWSAPAAAATFCAADACSWVPSPLAAVSAVAFAALTVGVLALSVPSLRLGVAPPGEFCFLLACSMTGGVVLGYAGDLITLIVGLETLTLPLYVLVGLRRFAPGERLGTAGASASVTFFLISVISTAVALLGAALNYAATGALHLDRLIAGFGPMGPVANGRRRPAGDRLRLQGGRGPAARLGPADLRRLPAAGGRLPVHRLQAGRRAGPGRGRRPPGRRPGAPPSWPCSP